MTPIENIAGIVQLAFGLGALWVLLFLFRSYRVDALRDHLFAVRQELFDYACSGGVNFTDPAYGKLRRLLNSLIRFAHQLTFPRLALGFVWALFGNDPIPGKPLEEWRQAMAKLSAEPRQKLEIIHRKALILVVRHLITGSPSMICIGLLFSFWWVIHGVTQSFLSLLAERLPGLDSLQAQAIAADSFERKSLGRGTAAA